jgi:hypothetical protein
MAEALALRHVVTVAKDHNYDKVFFVSDCLSLIQRLLSSKPNRSPVGAMFKDIKLQVASFASATFHHLRHSLDEAAHILARTCDVTSLGFISNSAPVYIWKTLLMSCDQ